MARKPSDPTLNSLAHELEDVAFMAPAHDFADREPGDDHPRVFLMPNQKTWAVRMFLGGTHRCIGYSDDLTKACRFADMAAMRFWKYRVRGAHPPTDIELNYGTEHTKSDCEHEVDVNNLLNKIEAHLKSTGSLPNSQDLEETRSISRAERDKRRTVRNDMVILFDDVFRALGEIIERLERMEGRGNPTAETFKRSAFLVDKKDFIVTVPNPIRTNEVLGKRLIQIPVRIVDGQEIILPEGLELIEKTKRDAQDEYIRIMQNATAPKDVIDTAIAAGVLRESPVLDIFPDTDIKSNQPNP